MSLTCKLICWWRNLIRVGGGVEVLLLHPCKINFLYVMLRVGEGAGRQGLVWFFRLQTQSSILGGRRKEENRQMYSEVVKWKSLHWPHLMRSHPSRCLHQDRFLTVSTLGTVKPHIISPRGPQPRIPFYSLGIIYFSRSQRFRATWEL